MYKNYFNLQKITINDYSSKDKMKNSFFLLLNLVYSVILTIGHLLTSNFNNNDGNIKHIDEGTFRNIFEVVNKNHNI